MSNQSHRYKWDDVTKDDSPSEFPTTTYPASVGAFYSFWSPDQRLYRHLARHAGLLWTMFAVIGASTLVLYGIAHWLRH